jgi:hypothetical protein
LLKTSEAHRNPEGCVRSRGTNGRRVTRATSHNWVFRNFSARNCSVSPITRRNGSRRPRSTGRLGADIRVCMALPQFAAMRKLAMSFRAILFGADPARSDARLTVANPSGPASHPVIRQPTQDLESVLVRQPYALPRLVHSDRRFVGALRLRKRQLMAASQVNAVMQQLSH